MGHVEVVSRLCDLKADVEAEKTQGGTSRGGSSIPGWTAFSSGNKIKTCVDTTPCSNYWEGETCVIILVCVSVFGSLALERMPDPQSATSAVWSEAYEAKKSAATQQPFWIFGFRDVDRWKVQPCIQLRTPTMRPWRRSFWSLCLHMKCHRYDIVEVLIYAKTVCCMLIQWTMLHVTRKPVVQILKLCYWEIPFRSTWQCPGFKRGDVWWPQVLFHQSDRCVVMEWCDECGWICRFVCQGHWEHCILSLFCWELEWCRNLDNLSTRFGFVDLCVCSFCLAVVCFQKSSLTTTLLESGSIVALIEDVRCNHRGWSWISRSHRRADRSWCQSW